MDQSSSVPKGDERLLGDEDLIVSKTDLTGRITYVNQTFLTISRYSEREVIGMQHSIVRHPDMPRCVFKLVWETLATGQEIFAYVVNLAKDGAHYWVFAHMTPTFDQSGAITGYHSNRRAPDRDALTTITELYATLLAEEKRYPDQRKGMVAASELLQTTVASKAPAYDEFIYSL